MTLVDVKMGETNEVKTFSSLREAWAYGQTQKANEDVKAVWFNIGDGWFLMD